MASAREPAVRSTTPTAHAVRNASISSQRKTAGAFSDTPARTELADGWSIYWADHADAAASLGDERAAAASGPPDKSASAAASLVTNAGALFLGGRAAPLAPREAAALYAEALLLEGRTLRSTLPEGAAHTRIHTPPSLRTVATRRVAALAWACSDRSCWRCRSAVWWLTCPSLTDNRPIWDPSRGCAAVRCLSRPCGRVPSSIADAAQR